MKRRDFVKNSLAATSGAMMLPSVVGCETPDSHSGSFKQLYDGFQNPPVDSRVFVRWWWNGNRLDEKEILRELDVMKAAGIGGVEINPIAFPQEADPAGYESMTIFTDEWLDMLQIALQGAKEREMICDMIVGSGWPYGGEFLKKEEQTQIVTIETIDLEGGQKHQFSIQDLLDKVDPEIHSKNKKVYRDLLMVRLLPKASEKFMEGIDVTENISDGVLSIDVPSGPHVLYYVVKLTGYMAVINGAPGAAGPVLNHYSKSATEAYLNRISGFITGKIGDMGTYIRAMFCDSMELEGANWNDDLPAEFEKRRGYDLTPYLPFVLKKVGHMGNPLDGEYGTKFSAAVEEEIKRVGIDFYQTRIELFMERFIIPFNDWCHRNNVKSRMQAYGRGMHPLEASMEIDIPECESWIFSGLGTLHPDMGLRGRAPLMCNKFVSSGAALAGKKVVSCEEITNTSKVFMITMEQIKIAGDQTNISGVNHSVLHGFNYSPPEAPFPGWIRYGTYFSENNPWWPWFRKWADYKARISYVLQNATMNANVALLQPLIDLWLKHGPQRDPFPQRSYPDYQFNIWEAVHQNGGGCDYVSENIIKNATFENGEMIYSERRYSVLLLPDIETLDVKTASSLNEFANAGGKIVFIGKKPFKSPTYIDGESSDASVKEIVEGLMARENVILYPAPEGDLIPWYGKLQDQLKIKPYVRFDKTDKYLDHSSFRIGENQISLIVNTSLSEHLSVNADFQVAANLRPWIWDPETGERKIYPTNGSNSKLQLELPPATSALIVFETATNGALFKPLSFSGREKEVNGPWHLKLNHINGDKRSLELDKLSDLKELNETREFAGEVTYEKTFTIDSERNKHIDLGTVKGISELTLNGKHLGSKWYGAHMYDVGDALKMGENNISIKVTTIVGNYLKGLEDNPVAMRWTRGQDYASMGILGPVTLLASESS